MAIVPSFRLLISTVLPDNTTCLFKVLWKRQVQMSSWHFDRIVL